MSKIDEAKLIEELGKIVQRFAQVSSATLKVKEIADAGYSEMMDLIQNLRTFPTKPKVLDGGVPIPNFFPDPYAEMVNVEDHGQVYEVYPVKFLGTDNFKEISEIVRKLGGSYVHGDKTQGVKAHFTIPKGEPKP